MFGIIATIIAAKKGHKTFAWVVGIWSVIEIVMLLAKSPYAVGPGGLFVLIAIGMKNLNKSEKRDITPDLTEEGPSNQPLIDTVNRAYSSVDSESRNASTVLSNVVPNSDNERDIPANAPSNRSFEFGLSSTTESLGSTDAQIHDSISPKVRYCRKCGFQLLVESDFCSHCGTKVVEARQA